MKQHEFSLSQEELGRIVAEVSQKAAVDADYRSRFVADPKAVIGEITGKQLPSEAIIDVIESCPDVVTTYVLPALNSEAQPQAPLVLSDQSEWTEEDYTATVCHVMNKASFDAVFRNDFLANPSVAIEKQAGKKIPEGFRFDVREARPEAALTFALPKFVGENGLTDEELLMIAAGNNSAKITASVLFGVVALAGIVATGGAALGAVTGAVVGYSALAAGTAGVAVTAGAGGSIAWVWSTDKN
jgi:hypothetical protein